jgi:hypothetical protein
MSFQNYHQICIRSQLNFNLILILKSHVNFKDTRKKWHKRLLTESYPSTSSIFDIKTIIYNFCNFKSWVHQRFKLNTFYFGFK